MACTVLDSHGHPKEREKERESVCVGEGEKRALSACVIPRLNSTGATDLAKHEGRDSGTLGSFRIISS